MKFKNRPAFFLLDILLGVSVFAIFIGIAGYSLVSVQNLAQISGDRARGAFLSQEAIEAVRSIRDGDFSDLIGGTFGVGISSGGKWELVQSPAVSADGFETSVQITQGDGNSFLVTADTNWEFGPRRKGTSSIAVQLSNWRQEKETGDWSNVSQSSVLIEDPPPLFNDIAVSGNYVFASGDADSGGAGLYIYDASNVFNPSRIAEGFFLGSSAFELAIGNKKLFVLADSPSAELKVYDISDPQSFSEEDLLGTYNLQGSGRGRSLKLFGSTLFVGAENGEGKKELYALDVSNPASISEVGSLESEGDLLDMHIHNGFAYIGSSDDVSELKVIDIFDPADLKFAPGAGYNLTDVLDGKTVAAFSDSVLLGRAYGDAIQELVLFDTASGPVPDPPPGPWFHGVGADVNSMDIDPAGKYAFLADAHDSAEFQVIDTELFKAGELPRIAFFDADSGIGRGIKYDARRDIVFFATTSALYILSPG
ncbi:MAG: hypothetical protein UX30_C0004G0014 [Candidatus Saccharibacteria bacterium GW2011_GWA2_46_10]|nr:MAG: hypothetical protein UX30_C0004G0014 [Candidatus Saccharibacteria bacterium GW2011_GWA2_46_10]